MITAGIVGGQIVDRLIRPRQETPPERAIRHKADAQLAQYGQDLGFWVAGPERILALQCGNGVHFDGAANRSGSSLGQPKITHLSCLHQFGERANRRFNRRGGVHSVLGIKGKDIHAQAL